MLCCPDWKPCEAANPGWSGRAGLSLCSFDVRNPCRAPEPLVLFFGLIGAGFVCAKSSCAAPRAGSPGRNPRSTSRYPAGSTSSSPTSPWSSSRCLRRGDDPDHRPRLRALLYSRHAGTPAGTCRRASCRASLAPYSNIGDMAAAGAVGARTRRQRARRADLRLRQPAPVARAVPDGDRRRQKRSLAATARDVAWKVATHPFNIATMVGVAAAYPAVPNSLPRSTRC